MKLLIAVVNKRDSSRLQEGLIEAGFRFTELGSTGGFLREGNVTLLIGVEAEQVEAVLGLIGEMCRPRERAAQVGTPGTQLYAAPVQQAMTVTVGGAQVFVLDVERVVHV